MSLSAGPGAWFGRSNRVVASDGYPRSIGHPFDFVKRPMVRGSDSVTIVRRLTLGFSDVPQKPRVRPYRRHVVDSRLFIEPWLIIRPSRRQTRARSGAHIPRARSGGDPWGDAGADIALQGGG